MEPRDTVTRQQVAPDKVDLARAFRRAPTAAERELWGRLRRSQLHGLHFRRQQIVLGFIADFYCHAAGLVVEVDGAVHVGRQAEDAARTEALAASGFRVLRLANDTVLHRPDEALRLIAEACGRT